MAINIKAIKSRIRSVKNTKKITRAMEMVSAVKMRKAVEATLNARDFAVHAKELLQRLSGLEEAESIFLEAREVNNVLIIVVSSNRGLCGSFNSNVIKSANILLNKIKTQYSNKNIKVDVLGVGKKSASFAKKNDLDLIGIYDQLNEKPSYSDVLPIVKQALKGFEEGKYDEVHLVYMNYISSMVQESTSQQILPLDRSQIEVDSAEPIGASLFEPSIEDIVADVVPRLIEAQVYQAILENSAGEHSARMVAMKSASDNATDMIKELTLIFNKGRQAAITQEIAEIAGGAVALE